MTGIIYLYGVFYGLFCYFSLYFFEHTPVSSFLLFVGGPYALLMYLYALDADLAGLYMSAANLSVFTTFYMHQNSDEGLSRDVLPNQLYVSRL